MRRFAICGHLLPPVAALGVVALLTACDSGGLPGGDPGCDDGSPLLCEMVEPVCTGGTVAAVKDSCWECVLPETCEPPTTPLPCDSDSQCGATEWCNPCGAASCPMCTDCVAVCQAHGCPTEAEASCRMMRPDCGAAGVAVVVDGCWECVDRTTCEVPRDERCDDGTTPLCNMIPPTCGAQEILAYQESCYACVNAATCQPWGEAGCAADADCAPTHDCDPCGTSSCPDCDNCLPACLEHGCPTETELQCFGARPDCDPGQVAVIQDGCWVCVDLSTCAL